MNSKPLLSLSLLSILTWSNPYAEDSMDNDLSRFDSEVVADESGDDLDGFSEEESSDDFCGKQILLNQIENKPDWKISGIEMIDKGIPRTGFEVFSESEGGEPIGKITSGSFCPTLNKTCGLVLFRRKSTKIGKKVFVDIRGRRKLAKVIKTPFYKRAV